MSDSPRPPLFGFVFAPKPPTPGAPTIRWMRIPARGPWRLALLIAASLAVASLAGSALLALAGIRTTQGLALASLAIAIGLPLVALVARGWIQGTYVNDSGVRIVRMWRTEHIPWPLIDGITVSTTGHRRRLLIDTAGVSIATTISSVTLDTALRPQTWDAAVDRMRIWHTETRPAGSDDA